jgi:hypothetical protein
MNMNMTQANDNYTSRVAWNNLLNSGKLKGMYLKVTAALYHNGECTAREIDAFNKKTGLWKRTNELRTLGLIEEADKRVCNITGEVAVTWRLPKVPPEDFGSQILFYGASGVVGFKNHTWRGFSRFVSIRRCVNINGAIAAEIRKHESNAEFVTVQNFCEVPKLAYEQQKDQKALTIEEITHCNMVVQAAHDVVKRLDSLPTSIKAAIDRHSAAEFDELVKVVDSVRDDLAFVIDEGKKAVKEPTK